jgi:hypothetical protein
VLLGAVSLVVFLSGEPAEEVIERLPGFSEAITERHEEAALVATIAMGVFGALAVGCLAAFRKRVVPRWIGATAFVAALGTTGLMGYAANLGGQVRHTEIRAQSAGGVDIPRGEQTERR